MIFKGEYVSKTVLKSVIYKLSDDIINHVLPVMVGQTVYRVNRGAISPVIHMTVTEIILKGNPVKISFTCLSEDVGQYMYSEDDINKQVFTSYDMAVRHLKEQLRIIQMDPED